MGKRKVLLPAAMLLSALSALAGMLPYILIWLIVRELLEHCLLYTSPSPRD